MNLRKQLSQLGSGARWVLGAVVTALIAWAVPTYAPEIFGSSNDDGSGSSGPPLAADVTADPARIDVLSDLTQQAFVPEFSNDDRPRGRGCTGFHAWVREHGGAARGRTPLRLTLRGRSRDPVLVTGVRARVLRSTRPNYPNRVVCPSAGSVDVRSASLRLESPSPVAKLVENGRQKPLALTLRKGETELVDVTAIADRKVSTWLLLVEYRTRDSRKTVTLRDGGEAFRTAGRSGGDTRERVWDWSVERWR